ncbi:hypothetical protein D3C86_1960110 [compost metagenome]
MRLQAQSGHDLGPTLGNRLLHRGDTVDTGLHHLQHIFDGQTGVDPLDDDRRPLVLQQFLVERMHGGTRGAT